MWSKNERRDCPLFLFPMSFSIIFKAFRRRSTVEVPAVQDLGIYLVDKESGEFAEKHVRVDELTLWAFPRCPVLCKKTDAKARNLRWTGPRDW